MEILSLHQWKQQQDTKSSTIRNKQVDQDVLRIIEQVQIQGDEALKHYTLQFDQVNLNSFEVTSNEWEQAIKKVDSTLLDALETAAGNIQRYQSEMLESNWSITPETGVKLGQQVNPLDRVGIYIPGGKASYPSTVLMDAIPAKVAGVKEIIITSPPNKNGEIDPVVLAAAKIAGVTKVYKVGGAQAIAALTYGTETIPSVDKIVGPGNIYVTRAKKWVFGDIAIDMIAGPSEICIFADSSAPVPYVAADLLSQAEHDEEASSLCITTDRSFAKLLQEEVNRQIPLLERKEIIEASISQNGKIIICDNNEEAINTINQLAPEHLQLMTIDSEQLCPKIKHAGAIFIGNYSSEPLGDYFAGPSHTLPTNGTAKFSSPLGVYDFVKKTSLIQYSKNKLAEAADTIITLAEAEGLTAHANAIRIRKENDNA
ncbi:histidinol dehydrogenase [Oceanobacillus iheyensis]|uniref:Histidinol dehydrogenase n=1 Tax=Oceanobacillus iheyensis (strain DSM 14371 / CIP 107618 / JCM 11309 / KCTC 3954 / HTE831) TaxID=221109 RepID=HISX_OCEIH|nr:histidinol dehydrogenase [Oceanobacillus iheyensis]Q8ESR8.1 RecName: Full=Histidinol dehydrogenase; Short=HDH [Oceanobacillus iheyensis HTE831]BAC12507.1 histidinol dehydrogenase [Oceanobacillus iheyensis HTE831]